MGGILALTLKFPTLTYLLHSTYHHLKLHYLCLLVDLFMCSLLHCHVSSVNQDLDHPIFVCPAPDVAIAGHMVNTETTKFIHPNCV